LGPWATANYCRAGIKSLRGTNAKMRKTFTHSNKSQKFHFSHEFFFNGFEISVKFSDSAFFDTHIIFFLPYQHFLQILNANTEETAQKREKTELINVSKNKVFATLNDLGEPSC
jgi:hypothetical protein